MEVNITPLSNISYQLRSELQSSFRVNISPRLQKSASTRHFNPQRPMPRPLCLRIGDCLSSEQWISVPCFSTRDPLRIGVRGACGAVLPSLHGLVCAGGHAEGWHRLLLRKSREQLRARA